MNAARNLVIDYRINGVHDHFIGKDKKTQPHMPKDKATKKKKRF